MKVKGQWIRAAGAVALLLVAGCRTPGAMGSGAMSASDSGSGNSGQSNSGDSGQSNSGQSNSGDSGSGNSSQSNSGQSKSSQSESSQPSSKLSKFSGESSQSSEGSSAQSGESSKNSSESSKSSQGSSSPVLSVTTLGATVGGLGLVIWQALKVVPTAPQPAAVAQAAQVYLRARTHQLREDLALGAGPSVEDLAAMARIRRENLRTFGRLLRQHRRELLALADTSTLTPERALAWLERVGQLARTDPRLDEDRRVFLASYGVTE